MPSKSEKDKRVDQAERAENKVDSPSVEDLMRRQDEANKRDRKAVRSIEERVYALEQYLLKATNANFERPEGLGAPEEEVERAKEQRARDREYLADRYQMDIKDIDPSPMLAGSPVVSQEPNASDA